MSDARLQAVLYQRDWSAPIELPLVALHVARYSWNALGGPEMCEVQAVGPEQALVDLTTWLRAGLVIVDWRAEWVWWGYLDTVEIRADNTVSRAGLDGMYNRVAVPYGNLPAGKSGAGTRATTTWAQDDDSVATYGKKEQLGEMEQATQAAAENYRDTLLAAYRSPAVENTISGHQPPGATLTGYGLMETLAWVYYGNVGTTLVETTTQVQNIVSAAGQFFAGVDVVNASGNSYNEYRDGDGLALDIILDLLRHGTTNKRRLLATATKDRYLRVYEEPAYDAYTCKYFLRRDGVIEDRWGNPLLAHQCPVGDWARHKGWPTPTNASRLINPDRSLLRRCEFNAETWEMAPEASGPANPWELTELEDG